MLETIFGISAGTWGVVMALAPTLQIRRMLQRRSSDDVSVGYLGVLVPGFLLWIGYGFTIGSAALVVPNVLAVLIVVTTIGIALRLRATSPTSSS